jgi:hypothetical protein
MWVETTRQYVLPQVVTIGPSFMPASGWARTHGNRIRRLLIDGFGRTYFEDKKRLFPEPKRQSPTITVRSVRGRLSSFLSIPDRVQSIGRQLGYGVGEDMDVLLGEVD